MRGGEVEVTASRRGTRCGDALLLTSGPAVRGRWSKAAHAEPFTLTSPDGGPLAVPAGRTWVELVPERGSVDL